MIAAMLVGAHVSTAGGLVAAYRRGVELGCDAIQVFNQSPRMWRPPRWKEDDVAAFVELMAAVADTEGAGRPRAVVIHAVYLINCGSPDPVIREKSLASLVHALCLGDAIGATGVVLHPGSALDRPVDEAIGRVADALREALAQTDRCPILLENTAGAGATLGRSFDELAEIVDRAGAHPRIGLCLDCCHLYASGFDVRTSAGVTEVMDECDQKVGAERLLCLHVNDSQVGLGANRDRHANLPDGELGAEGIAAFLSEPRFEGLPALLEVPGPAGKGPDAGQIETARRLREQGLAARAGATAAPARP